MKNNHFKLLKIIALSLFFIALADASTAQNVGINPTGSTPDESAGLDVDFTDKGFLPPRLTSAQRDAIFSPAEGLMIYNTTTKCFEGYNSDNGWFAFGCSEEPSPWAIDYVHCGIPTEIVDKTSPDTGKTWMDRNLGASREAQSSADAESYGSLFQWGRFADGHQCVNRFQGDGVTTSSTVGTQSSSDITGHGDFIIGFTNWRTPQEDNLWQYVSGTNNPCPMGYRLPTETEWNNEVLSWTGGNNMVDAFNSLALPIAGVRDGSDGALYVVGFYGFYWSSTVNGANASYLYFNSSSATMDNDFRAYGHSVRCFKD